MKSAPSVAGTASCPPRPAGQPPTHVEAPSKAISGRARPGAAVDERVLIAHGSTATAMETLTKQFESRVAASLERTGMKTSTLEPKPGASAPSWPLPTGWRWPTRSRCSSKPAAGPMWPLFPPGATRPGIRHRTERRQTDAESNGTGHGRARARPAVTSSTGPHRAIAEHDLCASSQRDFPPTGPARRPRRRLDRSGSGCVDPRTDRGEPWPRRVI